MKLPIYNNGVMDIYLDDDDSEIYLTIEVNDHTRIGEGYSLSMNELNRYAKQLKNHKQTP